MQYQLKIQQLVSYSRCRIYRRFLKNLSEDTTIRTNGSSYLFYFMTLCSLANFRTSKVYIDGLAYTISPGEWLMPIRELAGLYRTKTDRGVVEILKYLQESHYIIYSLAHRNRYVKFKINDWHKFNTVIEATAPCQKEDGFFFFPYRMVSEFVGHGKCSEMDIILDLWMNAIYKDERIAGSDLGPVVYYRNGTHSPLTGYEELGKRWCVSKSTAGRILRKLEECGYIKLMPFPGKHGTAIYLCSYLSTMFNISDVTVDKEEVAMSLNIKVNVSDETSELTEEVIEKAVDATCQNSENSVSDVQICVPEKDFCVPKSHLLQIVKKAAKVLSLQGIACASCTHARYSLSPLSDDCKRKTILTELLIRCPGGGGSYRFALEITPQPDAAVISERGVM